MSVVKYALVVFRLCYFAKGSINKTKAVLQWSTLVMNGFRIALKHMRLKKWLIPGLKAMVMCTVNII